MLFPFSLARYISTKGTELEMQNFVCAQGMNSLTLEKHFLLFEYIVFPESNCIVSECYSLLHYTPRGYVANAALQIE